MITYFKSQKDLAEALIKIIDDYWSDELGEDTLVVQINELVDKNSEKVFKLGLFTSVLTQRLGKRRIELLNKILNQTGGK